MRPPPALPEQTTRGAVLRKSVSDAAIVDFASEIGSDVVAVDASGRLHVLLGS